MSIRDYVFPYEAKNFPSFSIIFWISPCLYCLGFSGSCKLILRTSSEWLSAYSWQVRQPLKKNSFEKNTFEKWFRLLGRRRRQVSKFAVSPKIIKIRVCTNFLKVQTTEIYKNSAISGKNSIQRWLPFILIISFITPYPHPVQHRCESFTIRRPPSLDRPKRLRSCLAGRRNVFRSVHSFRRLRPARTSRRLQKVCNVASAASSECSSTKSDASALHPRRQLS